jgi:hypothetical protein
MLQTSNEVLRAYQLSSSCVDILCLCAAALTTAAAALGSSLLAFWDFDSHYRGSAMDKWVWDFTKSLVSSQCLVLLCTGTSAPVHSKLTLEPLSMLLYQHQILFICCLMVSRELFAPYTSQQSLRWREQQLRTPLESLIFRLCSPGNVI